MNIDPKSRAELEEAGIDYEKAVQSALKRVEELLAENKTLEAGIITKQLLTVAPDNLEALQYFGLILFRHRQFEEAINVIKKALELDPSNAENHNNIALAYLNVCDFEKAILHIEKAIPLNVHNYNFVNNKGLILRSAGDLDRAIECFRSIALTEEKNDHILANLGSAYGQKNMIDEAIDCFEQAIQNNPDNLGAHVDLAYAYHLKGDWVNAWREYEYRIPYWGSSGRFNKLYAQEKRWDGKKSLKNKTIVVYCEQGAGDMIQFVRFLPKLRDLGANVRIETTKELAPLFGDFDIINMDVLWDSTKGPQIINESEVKYDYHCSVLSLPYLLGLFTPDLFMSDKPYLFGRNLISIKTPGRLNVGVAWAGNPAHPNDAKRSVYLKNFKQIAAIPGVDLYGLQKETAKRYYLTTRQEIDLMEDCEDLNVFDCSSFIKDYANTADWIETMDLVVTVDTSVLHLAGAMGKKTYALIPYNPDWRWGIEGTDNVWYSSVKLFRQPSPGDWDSVFKDVAEAIKNPCFRTGF